MRDAALADTENIESVSTATAHGNHVEVKDFKESMEAQMSAQKKKLASFLENMKKRQEQKVNDLLEDNKELLESIKKKAADTKEVIEVRGREFDQMMEKTVCEAI